ncbi:MAG: FtsX-like permease family protein [Planctomycetes bacterium]|nr:FtsX-like permease family protein [Planctomycetota bacterium]
MMRPALIPVVLKQVYRHRARSLLTIGGVTIAMFLFVAVQTIQMAVHEATSVTNADTTLVVYRENRFCPATSRLPQFYQPRIAKIRGVTSVVPMKIVVSNCAASLDVITFRGLPDEHLPTMAAKWTIIDGDQRDWQKRSDAALVGELLAQRRGYRVGQSFDASGVTVSVAGIIRSSEPQDQNVAYVHLDFLQRAAAKNGVGIVTQFNVTVSDHSNLDEIARAIDAEFRNDAEPTQTRPEKAFIAQAGSDIVEIVRFTKYLGWGCLAAVLALVGNAIVLSVQDRIKELAVLQTLGFRSSLIAQLIMAEGILFGLVGGTVGTLVAILAVGYGNFSLSTEGLSVNITPQWSVFAVGLAISASVGVLAGLIPAWQASRREIAHCFRAV